MQGGQDEHSSGCLRHAYDEGYSEEINQGWCSLFGLASLASLTLLVPVIMNPLKSQDICKLTRAYCSAALILETSSMQNV